MNARILSVKTKNVEIALKPGKAILVPKTKLRFKYKIGDKISVTKKGNRLTFAPINKTKKILWLVAPVVAVLAVALYFPISTAIKNSDETTSAKKTKTQNTEKTTESTKKDPTVALNKCLSEVNETYYISDAEKEAGYSNTNIMIANLTKVAQWYGAQANCYEMAEGDYSSKILELQAKKTEVETAINSTKNINNHNYGASEPSPSTNYGNYTTTPAETPSQANEPSCDDYHAQYYANYTSQKDSITREYNSAISNASMQCSARGQSSCPESSNLRNKLEKEITKLGNAYKNAMEASGCDPALYVSF